MVNPILTTRGNDATIRRRQKAQKAISIFSKNGILIGKAIIKTNKIWASPKTNLLKMNQISNTAKGLNRCGSAAWFWTY
jgi:hypothetical protein